MVGAPSDATSDPAFVPGRPFWNASRNPRTPANPRIRFSTASAQTSPSPMASAVLLKRMPKRAPSRPHVPRMSQPAPTPPTIWDTDGQSAARPVVVVMSQLQNAFIAKTTRTRPRSAEPIASTLPSRIARRRGRWVRMVLSVSHPYSLPVTSPPMMSAIAPAKSGNPPSVFGIRRPGRRSPRSCPGVSPAAKPPPPPLRYATYGIR